jgi:hypothetical protein
MFTTPAASSPDGGPNESSILIHITGVLHILTLARSVIISVCVMQASTAATPGQHP